MDQAQRIQHDVATPHHRSLCVRASLGLLCSLGCIRLLFEFFDEFGDEEGEDEEGDGEGDVERDELAPVSGGPYFLEGADEKGEDKGAHDDAQPGAGEVVPEPDPGQSHAEIHGCKGEIDQPQVKHRGKSVASDRVVILSKSVAD